MRAALLHYSFWPVVGGVETVMLEHCRLLAKAGHEVTVFCGAGRAFTRRESENSPERCQIVPLPPAGTSPWAEAARTDFPWEISKTIFDEGFARLRKFLVKELAGHNVVFLHNVCTMPFDLALTAALWEAVEALPNTRFIAWVHDLAAANPDYTLSNSDEVPWRLLSRAHPRMEYVAVSQQRKEALRQVCGLADERCRVIPNGIDPIRQLGLSGGVERLASARRLLERDVVLLHPTRLLRRKNVELSLRVTAALRAIGADAALLITGAADPHNPASVQYAAALHRLRAELDLGAHAIFLGDEEEVTADDMSSLYRLADALFFPSRQEGFGLPMLEAAVQRIPAFCTDIEPLRGFPGAIPFHAETHPEEIAATIMRQIDASPTMRARKSVAREFAWTEIWRKFLQPLLCDSPTPTRELITIP